MKRVVMGSRRGNLVVSNKKPSQETHYHVKSYHSRFEYIAGKSSDRYQPCTFTFHVDAGKWCALAKPGRHVPGLEIYWLIGCGHASSLGGFPQRGLADGGDSGAVACACQSPSRVAGTALRR